MDNTIMQHITGLPTERQEQAIRLHRQIIANGRVAAECMAAIGRDLKEMRDKKLYLEIGCETFGDYCEQQAGIKERHGYNFIRVYERFGARLTELQGVGIAKLVELAKLDDDDAAEVIDGGALGSMTVADLKGMVDEYKRRCEQLTLDLEEAAAENSGDDSSEVLAENERLKAEIDRQQRELDSAAKQRQELGERLNLKGDELRRLEEKIKELESRPVEVAVREPSADEVAAIRADAEEQAAAQMAALREQVEGQIAERGKDAAKIASLEKELAEARAAQERPAPPAEDKKAQVKFYASESLRAFIAALEAVDEISDPADRDKCVTVLCEVADKMRAAALGD